MCGLGIIGLILNARHAHYASQERKKANGKLLKLRLILEALLLHTPLDDSQYPYAPRQAKAEYEAEINIAAEMHHLTS